FRSWLTASLSLLFVSAKTISTWRPLMPPLALTRSANSSIAFCSFVPSAEYAPVRPSKAPILYGSSPPAPEPPSRLAHPTLNSMAPMAATARRPTLRRPPNGRQLLLMCLVRIPQLPFDVMSTTRRSRQVHRTSDRLSIGLKLLRHWWTFVASSALAWLTALERALTVPQRTIDRSYVRSLVRPRGWRDFADDKPVVHPAGGAMNVLQDAFTALSVGSVYGVVGAGYVIIHRITGMVNFTQGDLAMAGAFGAVVAASWMPTGAAMAVGAVVGAIAGLLVYVLAVHPLRNQGLLVQIIATLGAAIVLRSIAQLIFGTEPYSLDPLTAGPPVRVAGASMPRQVLWLVAIMVLLYIALKAFFDHTMVGRDMS